MPNSIYSQNLRFLLPETVWLEPQHFLLAHKLNSSHTSNFSKSWQAYINTLALVAFEEWLHERLPNKVFSRDIRLIDTAAHLKVDKFKFCAIANEHLLNEFADIPQAVIETPALAAHFYVLLEVLEEEEEVIIRGFLSYQQLIEIKRNFNLSVDEGCYQIPLSLFDMEPIHLLVYQRYIQASAFALPMFGYLDRT